jgi:methylmalonyl-CoA mutase
VADSGRRPSFDDVPSFAAAFERPSLGDWEAAARRSLGLRTLESLTVEGLAGLAVSPLYTADDLPRGPLPAVLRERASWEACCTVDLREPEAAIRETMAAVSGGAASFWFAVDRRSSSWSRLTAAVLAELLEATGGAPVYLDGRAVTPALAAVMGAALRRRGAAAADLRGGFDFDPLGTLAANGTMPWDLESCHQLMADMVRWAEEHTAGMRAFAVSTLPYAKAGADAVQELALAMATAVEYLRRLERAGVPPEPACRRLRLVMPVGRDLFMETAKLRAARLLWANVARACGAGPESRRLPLHAVSSPVTLTTRDPWVNVLRGTAQAYAAVVGGADVLTVLPFDSAVRRPDALARRLALNTHNILREECRLDQVADPAHGSYFVERLTHDLAAAAWARFQRLEAAGGMAQQLQSGAVARELAESLARRRQAIATRRDPITGVSSFPNLDEEPLERRRRRRGARPLPDDESTAVRRALGSPTATFAEGIEDAAEGISVRDLLELFPGHGEPAEMAALAAARDAEPFERLRDASDRQLERSGARPHAFLAVLGHSAERRAAVAAVAGLLAAGGITTVRGEGLEGAADTVAAFAASGSRCAVICAPDEAVPELARELKAHGALRVLVGARPTAGEPSWRSAGVDGFIHPTADALLLLSDLLEIEGVRRD